tara:strand:+ start:438 stop:770 length:333 start_codon:yes stop_codon:yes gene_type:complete
MSKYISPVLKPINRHITIVPHPRSSKQDSDSTVLLPEDFAAEDERYITATVLDIAADCSPALRELRGSGNKNRTVVVERSMVEEIVVNNKSYFTVLENYVLGIMRGINEN